MARLEFWRNKKYGWTGKKFGRMSHAVASVAEPIRRRGSPDQGDRRGVVSPWVPIGRTSGLSGTVTSRRQLCTRACLKGFGRLRFPTCHGSIHGGLGVFGRYPD